MEVIEVHFYSFMTLRMRRVDRIAVQAKFGEAAITPISQVSEGAVKPR